MDPAIFQCLSWSWWGEPLPTRSLCFSTCTAGKWVCSTSVCPGTSDLHLGLYPFPPAPQLLEQGSWGPGLLVGGQGAVPQFHQLKPVPLRFLGAAFPDQEVLPTPYQGGFLMGSFLSVGGLDQDWFPFRQAWGRGRGGGQGRVSPVTRALKGKARAPDTALIPGHRMLSLLLMLRAAGQRQSPWASSPGSAASLCPSAECSVTGDIHFTTFDGRRYTFPATCQYILAKSRSSGTFTVTLQNAPCGLVRAGTPG